MEGIDATFGGISLGAGRDSAKSPPPFLLTAISAAAILSLACVGAGLIADRFAAEAVVAVPAADRAAPPAEAPADFGVMIVEPEWAAKPAPPRVDHSSIASLEASPSANIPLPSLEAFPLEPSAKAVPGPPAAPFGKGTSHPPGRELPQLENRPPLPPPRPPGLGEPAPAAAPPVAEPAAPAAPVENRNFFQKLIGLGSPPTPGTPAMPGTPPPAAPSPEAPLQSPGSEVARLDDSAPLPPPRPPGLGELAPPAAPQVVQPAAPPAPAENRNFFQKLMGLGSPPTPGTPAMPGTQVASIAPESDAAVKAPSPPPLPAVAAAPTPGGRGTGSGWFGFGVPQAPQGYDRQTAVYDISARTVYMPDGRRLEAHSGLGDRLDDPRYVDEQARGATPPHLYELTLREDSFHGVQALRLTPIGEGGVYGRAGLLAHPYMLGPNGDSNGCVSVKDYDAFLRAYENGQIKRLMVVASANQVIATAEPQSRSSPR
jgi:Protein of unknown function (DUF2778)